MAMSKEVTTDEYPSTISEIKPVPRDTTVKKYTNAISEIRLETEPFTKGEMSDKYTMGNGVMSALSALNYIVKVSLGLYIWNPMETEVSSGDVCTIVMDLVYESQSTSRERVSIKRVAAQKIADAELEARVAYERLMERIQPSVEPPMVEVIQQATLPLNTPPVQSHIEMITIEAALARLKIEGIYTVSVKEVTTKLSVLF